MFRASFIVLSFLMCPLLAAGASAASAFELVPGVVVDREGSVVYLMNPGQGIDAVNARSGALLWSSSAAAKPLLVHGDLLVSQAEPAGSGVLSIVVLARTDGTERLAVDVALPEGTVGSVADRLGSSFRAWATAEDGQVYVGWENVQRRVSPIPPKKGEKLQSRSTGGARIDLAAKAATVLAAAPTRPLAPVARLASDDGSTGDKLQAGEVLAETSMVGDGGKERLVLKRWETGTGAPLADVTLVDGSYHLRLPSADGRHLLVSRESNPAAQAGYTFQLFSLETGRLLGSLEGRRSYAFGIVFDTSFIYEALPYTERQGDALVSVPRQLRAVDLDSGTVGWERPIRDLAYRGPYRP